MGISRVPPLTSAQRIIRDAEDGDVGMKVSDTPGPSDYRASVHDALTTNFDMIRFGFGEPAFGATADAFRGTNFIGTAEAIMPFVDLTRLMPPFGILLKSGTDQTLTWTIRDNLSSGYVAFNVIAYGFDRIPD